MTLQTSDDGNEDYEICDHPISVAERQEVDASSGSSSSALSHKDGLAQPNLQGKQPSSSTSSSEGSESTASSVLSMINKNTFGYSSRFPQ